VYIFANCLACVIVSKISYLSLKLLVSDVVIVIAYQLGAPESLTGNLLDGSISWFKVVQTLLTLAIIIFPLSLKKEMSSFRYFSLVSLLALGFTLLCVIIEMPFYVNEYHPTLAPEFREYKVACVNMNFFNGVGIIFFAFTN
jgi:amino acid permease